MLTALINATIFSGDTKSEGRSVLIENGLILAVTGPDDVPADAQIIDLGGHSIAPGLIDLQIYGSGGELFGGKPTVEALAQMESDLFKQGTTGFLATVATNSPEIVEQAISAAKAFRSNSKGNFLGLHLEGPYLNSKRKGAHPEKFIKKATVSELKRWVDAAEGEIRIMTIAPELQDQEVLDYLAAENIVISAGHSNASYQEGLSFFGDKVTAATHLFNAMPPLHHREPGLVAAIFRQKPFTSIIADGIHVSYPMIEIAKRQLADKLFLITDAVTATSEGIYPHILNGDRYVMPDGTLSGSNLSMWQAVKNCVSFAGIELEEAIRMASAYPAAAISRQHELGYIKPGYKANLIIFDEQLNLKTSLMEGLTS
ncbi:N-acetylglucosamine-6-phosphate deacetylase [Flavihumibacter sp. R14]|nr:N-acetylglucosamine-6-phosphate deacetylase [Flavihumibacter soli]